MALAANERQESLAPGRIDLGSRCQSSAKCAIPAGVARATLTGLYGRQADAAEKRGCVASMLAEGAAPFGDEGFQPLQRGMAGGTDGEIVVDLFDPRARDAPRLLRRRQNCQRIDDRLLDNPIDHVGHRDLPKTTSSERRSAKATPIP
jgi:hypothetical protein